MDSRHLTFLQRNGVDTYNNYFNRDNKRTLLVPLEFMTNGISQRMQSECKTDVDLNDPFIYNFRIKYDPFCMNIVMVRMQFLVHQKMKNTW